MDFRDIRKAVIVAMFADDVLMQHFVLKGGNALNIVYEISARTSIDVDLSMAHDFADVADARRRIERALTDRFDSLGFELFDFNFSERPRRETNRRDDRWGGYRVEFKLVPHARRELITTSPGLARRSAVEVAPEHGRVFRVEISKYEYCDVKIEWELDDYLIYVYPPFLLAAEKLRALCQQMPEYTGRRKATARARDFFDIHSILTDGEYREPENFDEIVVNVFAAKEVPLEFLDRLPESREFHRIDWPSVTNAASGPIESFDFYFDFVVEWAKRLRSPSG
jgi:hypothetical protein